MSAWTSGTKRRWVWSGGGAALVAGLIVLLFSRPHLPAPAPVAPRARPAIELAERREKSALDDEATLLDPTPLFQPTRWNTAQQSVAPPEPGGTFRSYRVPANWSFVETDLKLGRAEAANAGGKAGSPAKLLTSLDLPEPVTVPAKPAAALAAGLPGPLVVGFGRTDQPVPALPVHGATVEIVAAGTGRTALLPHAMAQVQALAAAARPPGGRSWQAMEFLATVDSAGLAAPLMMTTRSGVEEVDSYFQNFVARTLRVGERLTPGFYRIAVGP
jgi:hypothetical protein